MFNTFFRTNTCGELRISDVGRKVVLAGWVQKSRKLGGMTFIDLRDRYGITQLVVETDAPEELVSTATSLGREFVIQVEGEVVERQSKNPKMDTGDIEIKLSAINVLNKSVTPPFTIEDESNGGEDIRAKYRYLDLRRNPLKNALMLRHKIAHEVRNFLDSKGFMEIETPYLIKSTPEGARDFVVPSRMNPGEFYALPQSPQTFKQLLMVAGYDRYFQIVRCFRDEDLRADRQPEFTQIDCEMSFVEQEDVLDTFEEMMRNLFKNVLDVEIANPIPRMKWCDAMDKYGSDKPDIRFGMTIHDITSQAQGHGFSVFDSVEYVGAISVPGASEYTRKQIDELTEWVKRPQVGAKGLVYIKYNADGSVKSSVDKFYTPEQVKAMAEAAGAVAGDLVLILCGGRRKTQTMLGVLRIEMGNRLGLRNPKEFAPLWIVDFPLLEWDDETQRFYAMHHPFTAPKPEQLELFYSDRKEDLEQVCANAYDFVLNGTELGGGSIRIHEASLQERMFEVLGISKEDAEYKFGFIINAFKFGAPPHGGLAFGFDRVCALFGGCDSIRDYIAFPKNNQGRDVMIDSPSRIDQSQLDELYLDLREVK
ncbi:MAG: aspartate--tRNA ligase [Candidatus Cryptobacteroides sp.]|mgnify:FL=1|nr:aspartate--tRNA ligase [Bacteroidales bacterium]MDD7154781.1 aspartate--tRNA ligase [Bacteroidales bacterium]MDY4572040.1 aspartate--tRNA ligase [Candidatus Cryptobacteroides sp.]MDY5495928.1 aspartate--tRNA ligase [Candidatus Cryptobacteroides sp.]MDY6182306.1 aspartate--tRNA ligase [Candidatus Cryptobacteroides sp.]